MSDALAPATLAPAETSMSPPVTQPPETAEFYRQLFVAAYDAVQGTDGYGATFGDDPRVAYASGDKTPLPIEELAATERGRFGYENNITIASLKAAQDAARDQWTHIKEALEAAEIALERSPSSYEALSLVRAALGKPENLR